MSPAQLVARDALVADLRARVLEVRERGAAVLVLAGAAGVGTSAVADEVADRHHGPTLRARGAAWETGSPYGVLSQLLGRPVDATDPVAAGSALVAGLDEVGTTLVVVDDATWCDVESLQALSSAVHHHRHSPILVLLVSRSGDPTVPAAPLRLLAEHERVVVPPLDASGTRLLAAARGIHLHPSLSDRLCRHTGGRPAYVVALLEELPAETWHEFDPQLPAPSAVAAQVAERLPTIGATARSLVEAVAVLGTATTLAEAAAVAGLDEPLAALDEAVGSGLVRTSERRGAVLVEPADPTLAAAVLATLGGARRADVHTRAAEAASDPARRLGHRVAASPLPDPRLATELEELAEERAASGAWGEVAELLAQASRLTDERLRREDLLARAADALVGAGDALGAAALVPELDSLRETPLRNAVLGYLAVVRGRPGEAEARLQRAWDLVNVERDPEVAATVCQRWVLHGLGRCRGADVVDWADRAISLGEEGSPAAVEAAAIRGLGLAASGRPREALEGYARLSEEVGHGAQAQRISMGWGWLLLAEDDLDAATAALESAVPTDFLGGSTRISLWARAWLARAQFQAGRWDEALHTAQEGLDLVERSGMALVGPLLAWTRAQVLVLRGDDEAASETLRTVGDAGPRDYEIMRVPSCLARAAYAEAHADYAGVVRALTSLRQPWATESIDEPGAWPWVDVLANALVVEGRLEEADRLLVPHERLARERGHRSARARLGYARGRLQGALGDIEAATATFEESLRLLEELPLRYDRARVGFAYGQTLRRAGKRREADAVLTAARDLYASMGATTYVVRCERELKAGGVHTVRVDRAVDELTPQEEAVAALVAQGRTNRQVAAELFLSPKTVQYHLTRTYAKLGIRSRTELAALRAGA